MKKDNWRFEALARAKIVQQEEEARCMTEHTPGPWIKNRNVIEDSKGNIIAEVSYKQDGYVQANANLIAAAPDLLSACKDAVPLLKKHACKYHGPMVCDKCYAVESLNSAIAKAEEVK